MIEAYRLSGGYIDFNVHQVSLTIKKGEFFAILGPNGSGKTTLMKLLSGALIAQDGEVLLKGKPLQSYSSKEKAKLISVLGQEQQVAFDFTVEEVVALGRYPHQRSWLGLLTPEDQEKIEEALRMTRLTHLRHQPFYRLSGGEKQRVLLAKALAQEAEALFLDEPTNHLDINFTIEMLDLLKTWQQSKGLTIVAILHDVNVAALYADRLGLMQKGRLQLIEEIGQLHDARPLEKLYAMKVESVAHPRHNRPQFMYTSQQNDEKKENPHLTDAYQLTQNGPLFHLHFDIPFKVMSNSQWGNGLRWANHFCQFYLSDYHPQVMGEKLPDQSDEPLKRLLQQWGIPLHQTAGTISCATLEHYVLLEQRGEHPLLAVVTAACPLADLRLPAKSLVSDRREIMISVMLFIDGFMGDGTLLQALIVAEQAKTRALLQGDFSAGYEYGPKVIQGREMMLIAATQRGTNIEGSASEAALYQAVGQLIFEATQKVLSGLKSVV